MSSQTSLFRPTPRQHGKTFGLHILLVIFCAIAVAQAQTSASVVTQLSLKPGDLLPTGNEWISLPTIRAADAALQSFNVLSMRDRGLLEVTGASGRPVLQPSFTADYETIPFQNPRWELLDYWIPRAHLVTNGLELTVTYCAPPGSRAAFVRLTIQNQRSKAVKAAMGVQASWGGLNRVAYLPVALRGERTIARAPWVNSAEVFSFITHDTQFAWALAHPGAEGSWRMPPLELAPTSDAQRETELAPGGKAEAIFVISAGIEEFSAAHSAKALTELIDRHGTNELIQKAGAWCRERTRTTGQPDLDLLMNRNYLFTRLYAWGKTIDTEQTVGVTSRSPLYYVSAAYWDRDAMLWSFPAVLDIDKEYAREILDYALTLQLRNTGVHSRFIDGVVLEDGFQLDEQAAPVLAAAAYLRATQDTEFLQSHRAAIFALRSGLLAHLDPTTGLYSTLQDSQDEYQKLPFITYDNVLTWKAFLDLAELFNRLQDPASSRDAAQRAETLRKAILTHCVSDGAPKAGGTIFVFATDGQQSIFGDVPPGSLMKLPVLGFVDEADPIFSRTYDWLNSPNYEYSYSKKPYGLPGTARLPFTASWSVADYMNLNRGREKALKILRATAWDAGIITEGVDSETGVMEEAGRAFATASGYIAHTICRQYCSGTRPQ